MRVGIVNLHYSPRRRGFDDGPLQEFLEDKELLRFDNHFYEDRGLPQLVCVVEWCPPPGPGAALDREPARRRSSRKPSGGSRGVSPSEPVAEVAVPEPEAGPESVPGRDRPEDPVGGLGGLERERYDALRLWRTERAREDGVPPYRVLTNRELVEVVRRDPRSADELLAIPGIGGSKVERFGEALLAELARRRAPANGPAGPGAMEVKGPD